MDNLDIKNYLSKKKYNSNELSGMLTSLVELVNEVPKLKAKIRTQEESIKSTSAELMDLEQENKVLRSALRKYTMVSDMVKNSLSNAERAENKKRKGNGKNL